MESPAGLVGHCNYDDSFCQLQDGSQLLWEPNKTASCEIIPWQIVKGKKYGSNFLADDHNIALTFTNVTYISDCQRRHVQVSDQGIPVAYVGMSDHGPVNDTKGRARRELNRRPWDLQKTQINVTVGYHIRTHELPNWNEEHGTLNAYKLFKRKVEPDGVVTTDLLAASLQAVDFGMRELAHFAYLHAMRSTCQSWHQIVAVMRASTLENPTLVARILLNPSDIIATAGGGAIEIFPCIQIPKTDYRFISCNRSSCT